MSQNSRVPRPASTVPGESDQVAVVEAVLTCIIYGYVDVELRAAGASVPFLFNDVSDDLSSLADFTEELRDGRNPRLTTTGNGEQVVCSIHETGEPGLVRAVAERMNGSAVEPTFDVVLPRAELVTTFRGLLRRIADDERLGPMWIDFGLGDSEEFDRVLTAAEAAWQALVVRGEVDEDMDAEDDFMSRYLSRHLTLPDWAEDQLRELQERLRSV